MPRDQIFISYSHNDRRWLDELLITVAPLLRRRDITIWDDTKIRVGTKWKAEISAALKRAKVAVLLVSRAFLASDFTATSELPQLLEAAEKDGLIICWIAVGFSLYEHTEITEYQAANNPTTPLNSLSEFEVDRELVRIGKMLDSLMSIPKPEADRGEGVAEISENYAFLRREPGVVASLRPEVPDEIVTPEPDLVETEQRVKEVVERIVGRFSAESASEVAKDHSREQLSFIHQRLRDELANGRWAWRSIHALSGKAGMDEETTLELLRADPHVELGRSKTGRIIARLKQGNTGATLRNRTK